MVMRLAFLKSCVAVTLRLSSALVMDRLMMPSSFIFDIYFANIDWRRRSDLSLNFIWCLFALIVSVVVFVSVCFV